jgi:hypothetical protein
MQGQRPCGPARGRAVGWRYGSSHRYRVRSTTNLPASVGTGRVPREPGPAGELAGGRSPILCSVSCWFLSPCPADNGSWMRACAPAGWGAMEPRRRLKSGCDHRHWPAIGRRLGPSELVHVVLHAGATVCAQRATTAGVVETGIRSGSPIWMGLVRPSALPDPAYDVVSRAVGAAMGTRRPIMEPGTHEACSTASGGRTKVWRTQTRPSESQTLG